MRKVIDLQMEFWRKDITDIEFDFTSGDEIPKLLMGLQYIYRRADLRKKVFRVLEDIVPIESHKTGRPGMDLWKILVPGTVRLNCNWDFDKVQEMANNYRGIRMMLAHSEKDFDSRYPLQTIKDNVSLLTPQILDQINQIVVKAGHGIVLKKAEELKASCDSVVVETDVHYPSDTKLLFDAVRKMINVVTVVCSELGITEWRKSHHQILKVKRLLRGIENLKRSTSKDEDKKDKRDQYIINAHQNYIQVCQDLIFRAKGTIRILRELELLSVIQDLRLSTAFEYIAHA
ncbi:MAG: hypothetical protein JRI77_16510 [Deltaproteobacteria bacterium]|nr:hypothetical protein [Deltaproteobacteria bacterium]